MSFKQYVALGDSMSIDLYPALDAGEIDVTVALEWDARAGAVAPLGAASLLHRNVNERYPEFAGNDLVSLHPDVGFVNLAEDGATIGDVFGSQLPLVAESEESTLLTLSIGGSRTALTLSSWLLLIPGKLVTINNCSSQNTSRLTA